MCFLHGLRPDHPSPANSSFAFMVAYRIRSGNPDSTTLYAFILYSAPLYAFILYFAPLYAFKIGTAPVFRSAWIRLNWGTQRQVMLSASDTLWF
jgi:hypothetical protein